MFAGILIVILICVVFLGAFSVQNTGPVDVRFFNLIVASTPVYVLVIISAALGAAITTLVAAWSRARQSLRGRPVRRKAVEQEKAVGGLTDKVSELEAERDRLVDQVAQLSSEREDLRSHVAELQNGLGLSKAEVSPAGNGLGLAPGAADPGADSSMVVPEALAPRTEEPVKKVSPGWWSRRSNAL